MELSKKFFFEMDSYTEYAPNTFIGGAGNVLTSPEILVQKLVMVDGNSIHIPVNWIKNFRIDELGTVSFYIGRNYTFISQSGNNGFENTNYITSYWDLDGKVLLMGSKAFTPYPLSTASIMQYAYFPSCFEFTGIQNFTFRRNQKAYNLEKLQKISGTQDFRENGARNLRLPLLTEAVSYVAPLMATVQYGDSKRLYVPRFNVTMAQESGNLIFGTNFKPTGILYTHPDMATANAGSPHPSVQAVIDRGASVRYVSNFTPPTPITDLSVTPSFNSVTVNFTPSTAVNGMDFYEVWLTEKNRFDHVQKFLPNDQEITTSGQTITGLKVGTEYVLRLASCDTMYNGSGMSDTPAFSNEVIFKTL